VEFSLSNVSTESSNEKSDFFHGRFLDFLENSLNGFFQPSYDFNNMDTLFNDFLILFDLFYFYDCNPNKSSHCFFEFHVGFSKDLEYSSEDDFSSSLGQDSFL